MGGSKKEVVATGGGPAKPLAEDITRALRQLIAGEGAPGGSLLGRLTERQPFDITQSILQGFQGVEGVETPASVGQALQQIIQRDIDRQVADLRARFGAAGGTALGTPGAVGEAQFRAEAVPRATTALGELGLRFGGLELERQRTRRTMELQPLLALLGLTGELGGRGIPQAQEQLVISPPWWKQAADVVSELTGAGAAWRAAA